MIATSLPSAPVTFADKLILIVEDHADSLDLINWTLKSLAARTLSAGTVADAQSHVLASRLDLIVCDMRLPDGNGVDFVRWLRSLADPKRSNIPAVAITAFPSVYPPSRTRRFDAYLTKPLDIGRFCSSIAALLK